MMSLYSIDHRLCYYLSIIVTCCDFVVVAVVETVARTDVESDSPPPIVPSERTLPFRLA